MACPSCGGGRRREIAPGFYECSSEVPSRYHLDRMRTETCGHRYQEAATGGDSLEQCACGTFAIGSCQTCGAPICGDHSALWGGKRTCGRCRKEEGQARLRAEEEARLAWQRRNATLPVMTFEELVSFLRGDIESGDTSRVGAVDGAELADALDLARADVCCHLREKRGWLRDDFVVEGWLLKKEELTKSDFDSQRPTGTSVEWVLERSGSLYKFSYHGWVKSIAEVSDPSHLVPAEMIQEARRHLHYGGRWLGAELAKRASDRRHQGRTAG